MAGTATEQILILIAFGLEHFGHLMVRFDPVVHTVAHNVWIERIPIAHGNEQADRLPATLGNNCFVKAPGAIRELGIKWPRLVHEGTRSGEHAPVKIRAEPGHD